MTVLLDTHVFLYWLLDSPLLSRRARAILADGENRLLWSSASSLEVAQKIQLGRLKLPGPAAFYLPERLAEQGVESLPIENSHALRVAELPMLSRDPFDRLLVAQAQVEGLSILSDDPKLAAYGVPLVY